MIVNIAFFKEEPIDNIITCLNYRVGRVIFFGYCDIMTPEAKKFTQRALRNYCAVKDVAFVDINRKKFPRIVRVMEEAVEREARKGNQCFLDLTGSDNMFHVAMGGLADRYQLSMHSYDVAANDIYVLNEYMCPGINRAAESRRSGMTLRDRFSLGGVPAEEACAEIPENCLKDKQFKRSIEKVWTAASKNFAAWNEFSAVLKGFVLRDEEEQRGYLGQKKMEKLFLKHSCIRERSDVLDYLRRLERAGVVRDIRETDKEIGFAYENAAFRTCFQDPGILLKCYTYYERGGSALCRDSQLGRYVLLLEGNVLTFVLCKWGKVSPGDLRGLRDAVEPFGGKYVRAELVTAHDLPDTLRVRAEDMGINVIQAQES